jgi:hypothetical protein
MQLVLLHHGINVRLRYLLRVTMQRGYGNTVVQEFKYWVRNTGKVGTFHVL